MLTEPDSTYSEPEPALAVTREATSAYVDRHPGPSDILLIVEVSDTSIRTDLLVKARLYARAGIPEYWALDLPNRRLHVHREPAGQDYSTVTVVEDGGSVAYEARPESVIAVADLLPPVAR
jgi:Uma2 family endonuclease